MTPLRALSMLVLLLILCETLCVPAPSKDNDIPDRNIIQTPPLPDCPEGKKPNPVGECTEVWDRSLNNKVNKFTLPVYLHYYFKKSK